MQSLIYDLFIIYFHDTGKVYNRATWIQSLKATAKPGFMSSKADNAFTCFRADGTETQKDYGPRG